MGMGVGPSRQQHYLAPRSPGSWRHQSLQFMLFIGMNKALKARLECSDQHWALPVPKWHGRRLKRLEQRELVSGMSRPATADEFIGAIFTRGTARSCSRCEPTVPHWSSAFETCNRGCVDTDLC